MKRDTKKGCPFLGEEKALYCRAFPLKKPLPFDRIYGPDNLCLREGYHDCPIFKENGGGERYQGEICPFVEVETVCYCELFPAKKVPLSGVFELGNPCATERHETCPLFLAVKQGDLEGLRVAGEWRMDPSVGLLPNHYWVRGERNVLEVGLDDFAQALIGKIRKVSFRRGRELKKGEVILVLEGPRGQIELLSPFSGEILEVNHLLLKEPSWLNRDPYGKGWIMKVKVTELPGPIYQGEEARAWLNQERERVLSVVGGSGTLADGGEFSPVWGSALEENVWKELVGAFLYTRRGRR